MKIICLLIICLSIGFALPTVCAGGCAPLQISLWSPIQLVQKDGEICGVRLNLLMGQNAAVYGLDVGLVNIAGGFKGLQVGGILSRVTGSADMRSWGMQVAGIVNSDDKAPFTGFQLAGLVNDFDGALFTGVQIAGIMNDNDNATFTGAQIALWSNQNYGSQVNGLQVALFNQAQKFNGLQLGLGNGVSAGAGAVSIFNKATPFFVILIIAGPSYFIPPVVVLSAFPAPVTAFGDTSRAPVFDTVNGIQFAAITNITQVMNGLQVSVANFARESLNGVQLGVVNAGLYGFPVVNGVQLGVVYNLASDMNGLQLGGLNYARDVKGFQVGFVNICKNLKGLQVGAVNIVTSRFPGSIFFAPIINFGF